MTVAPVFPAIRKSMRELVLAVPDLPTQQAWEGRPFVPVVGVPYLTEMMTPAVSVIATQGTDGFTREDVVYSVGLFYPADALEIFKVEGVVDTLAAAFHAGRHVGSAEVFGRVMGARRTSGRVESGWYSIFVHASLFVYRRTVAS